MARPSRSVKSYAWLKIWLEKLPAAFRPALSAVCFLAIKSVSRAKLRKTRKELIQWFCIYWRAEGRLQGLSEQFLGQRQRRLEIPKTDKLKRLRTFLLRILTRPEQRTAFKRQANRYLADLQGSRSSSSTTSGHDEESPAKQLSKSLQEYKHVTGEHRALISKKIRLQAKTEALKKQFEEAVDQLTAVSGKIEAVEQEMEKAHARVKDQINAPKQPRITGVTNLLKEAGVTLSPDQTGALTKFLATVGDQDLDVPSLWKAEAGVPGELLDSDWFSQEANGRHGEYGPSRNDHRTRSNPLSRRSRSPRVREPMLKRRDSGCLV